MTSSAEIALRATLAESPRGRAVDVRDEQRRQAFERVVEDHAALLHAIARRLLSAADVEDAVQDTFVKAWRGLDRFRDEANLRTWLVRILLNTCHDRQRRALRSDRVAPPPARHSSGPSSDPALGAARNEFVARIWDAVETLPLRQREALLLRTKAGLAYQDIARLMGIAEGAVKSHLVQARRKLIEKFGRELTS